CRPCPPARPTCDEVRRLILQWLGHLSEHENLVLCVPSDATDAWVLAALFPEEIAKHFRGRLAKATNREKERLRELGAWVVFECKHEPADMLAAMGVSKTIESYRLKFEAIKTGWIYARKLPEAGRFEADLRRLLKLEA